MACHLTLAFAVLFTASAGAQSKFDVASIKDHQGPREGPRDFRRSYGPQGINFTQSLLGLIGEAYNLLGNRIVLPRSVSNETLFGSMGDGYDVIANTDHPVNKEQLRVMLQTLLADRFKLTVHRESKTTQVYKLVVAKGGPKLEESQDGGDLVMTRTPDGYLFRNAELLRLAGALSSYTDHMVVDETGLGGLYNFTLKLPDDVRPGVAVKSDSGSADAPAAGAFADSLKPLGLQLVAASASVEFLVIDHVERPSAN